VTTRQTFRRLLRAFVMIGALAVLGSACAQHIGKQAAAGAVSEMQRQSAANPDNPQVQKVAAKAVEGAVTELDSPAEVARIDHLVSQAASTAANAAVAKATEKLMAQLGEQGEGPLAVSFARTGQRVSAAAVGSVGSELLALAPECAGPDPLACIEKRLQQTARTTAASFSAGVRETLGWQFLLVAFGLGAGGGVLGTWLWSLRPVRRRSLRTA
jgi:hypothetical protein